MTAKKIISFINKSPLFIYELGLIGFLKFILLRRYDIGYKGQLHQFSVKRLNGKRVYIRSGTTDIITFQDYLESRYYLPHYPLPEKPIIVDLGANIGLASLDYAVTYPESRIFAVEMDKANFIVANRNCSSLGTRVNLICAAVWHKIDVVCYEGAGEDGYHVTTPSNSAISVETITISQLLKNHRIEKVNFLKMDIEGAEEQIFGSNELDWLEKIDQINCEIHGKHLYQKIASKLENYGFKVCRHPHHWNSIIAKKI
jgi:FkbM family methyltransferase